MAKKLDIKIRETKDLERDSFDQTVATCAIIARLKSSVKVARHKWGCGKELGEEFIRRPCGLQDVFGLVVSFRPRSMDAWDRYRDPPGYRGGGVQAAARATHSAFP